MRSVGLRGVMRAKVLRTTIGDAKATCPLDRVNRKFGHNIIATIIKYRFLLLEFRI